MGSDLHMNPPAPDKFRAKWVGDTLRVERWRDGIYGADKGGNRWTLVWTGKESDIKGAKELLSLYGFHIPPKPSKGEIAAGNLLKKWRAEHANFLAYNSTGGFYDGQTAQLKACIDQLQEVVDNF